MGEDRTEDGSKHCGESSPINLPPNVPAFIEKHLPWCLGWLRAPSHVHKHAYPSLLPFHGQGALVVKEVGLPPGASSPRLLQHLDPKEL